MYTMYTGMDTFDSGYSSSSVIYTVLDRNMTL